PEQKRAMLAHPFAHLGDRRLVAVRDRPAAVLKSTLRVLIRPGRCLHHAVKRHPVHHDHLPHCRSFRSRQRHPHAPPSSRDRGVIPPLTPYTSATGRNRHSTW